MMLLKQFYSINSDLKRFSSFSRIVLEARTSGPILTIYTSYGVFPRKELPFWGLVHTASHFGAQILKNPYFGGI